MNYNKIIIALVIILVAVAVAGFIMINQTEHKTTNNATNKTNSTNNTNISTVTPHITTDDVNTGESESSSARTYADMAHDSDAHTNPEKAKELNDNIVGGKDGIYYFSDGSYVDMR